MNIIEDIDLKNYAPQQDIVFLEKINTPTPKYRYMRSYSAVYPSDEIELFVYNIATPNFEENKTYVANQEAFEHIKSLVKSFCEKHNISFKRIFRAAINIMYPIGILRTEAHVDHEGLEHKQLLIYLNDGCGDTVILNEDKSPLKIVRPEKHKAICFDGKLPHYNYLPTSRSRAVLVITFE